MFDTGSSTGEIVGHSKVRYTPSPSLQACASARSGHIEDNYVQLQVINAVAIRRQRPFRAATASDDNLIVFHQGKCCYFVRLRTKLLNTKNIPGAPYRFDKARHSSPAISTSKIPW
jgi:hypothetical protein